MVNEEKHIQQGYSNTLFFVLLHFLKLRNEQLKSYPFYLDKSEKLFTMIAWDNGRPRIAKTSWHDKSRETTAAGGQENATEAGR